MVPESPTDALGAHTVGVRDLMVEVVRTRHALAADAHQTSRTRYELGFGSQWRDLLDDACEALADRGFRSRKLLPAGYKISIVNGCLVYVWRVPDAVDAVSLFASSPTRKNGFDAPLPDPMLDFTEAALLAGEVSEHAEIERMIRAAGDTMPLVLIMVQSSPRQLQSIEWAVAELDPETGKVKLLGREIIWEPELTTVDVASDVEAFDSGSPAAPAVELHTQDGTQSDV